MVCGKPRVVCGSTFSFSADGISRSGGYYLLSLPLPIPLSPLYQSPFSVSIPPVPPISAPYPLFNHLTGETRGAEEKRGYKGNTGTGGMVQEADRRTGRNRTGNFRFQPVLPKRLCSRTCAFFSFITEAFCAQKKEPSQQQLSSTQQNYICFCTINITSQKCTEEYPRKPSYTLKKRTPQGNTFVFPFKVLSLLLSA